MLCWLSLACTSAIADARLVLIGEEARPFNPSAGERAHLTVIVPAESKTLSAAVYARDGTLVRTLTVANGFASQRAELDWDGRDEEGQVVPDEAYGLYLVANDVNGDAITELDLRESAETPLDFAPGRMNSDLRIEATLDRAARVQVRIGIEGGPLLRTLLDWQPRMAGRFTVPWDGFDQSGKAFVADDTDLKVLVSVRDLQRGALLTFGNPSGKGRDAVPDSLLSVSASCAERADEPSVNVTVSRAASRMPVEGGYEVAFYINHAFVSEEERGYLPIRWRWNASGTSPGQQLLTVNLMKFDGDILLGSTTVDTGSACSSANEE